jgi:cell division protein FtsA
MQRTIVGIDIGTTKVGTVVAQLSDSGRLNILGVGVAPSKGLDKGVVVNIDNAVSAIETSIEKAERLTGYRIGTAFVGVSGRHISSLNSRGVVAVQRPDQEITRSDIARAVEAAQAVAIPTQREIIHVIPRAYILDGHEGIRDPIGMSGFRLEVETHIVTGEVMAIQNLIRSVQKSGIGIDELVLQPLASGEAVLSAEDKDRGVVLVDIGGSTSDVAIFVQGGVWHTSVISLGGNHFTNDITYVLHTPQNTAEYLKLRYGSAIAGEEGDEYDDEREIEIDTLNANEKQRINRNLLNQILQARAEELVELIYQEIRRSGYEGRLPAGVVLTGGGAQLARLDELVREMLGLPVRIGRPNDLAGLTDTLESPSFATCIGLLRWGLRNGSALSPSQRSADVSGRGSAYERLKNWLREFLP